MCIINSGDEVMRSLGPTLAMVPGDIFYYQGYPDITVLSCRQASTRSLTISICDLLVPKMTSKSQYSVYVWYLAPPCAEGTSKLPKAQVLP